MVRKRESEGSARRLRKYAFIVRVGTVDRVESANAWVSVGKPRKTASKTNPRDDTDQTKEPLDELHNRSRKHACQNVLRGTGRVVGFLNPKG